MGDRLQKALDRLERLELTARTECPLQRIDTRAKTVVTLVFLVAMLSLKLSALSDLMLFALFPVVWSSLSGIGYGELLRRSTVVLPFVALIGIFNPLLDRQPVLQLGSTVVTAGWISFASITLRGMISVQAVMLLVLTGGFHNLCRALQRLGVPSMLTVQLLLLYRYIHVLIAEFQTMRRARDARSFGRDSYPVRIWGAMVGQLLVRTFERAERIHSAMLARGFDGHITGNVFVTEHWTRRDTLFTALWCGLIILMRVLRPAELIF